jgi:excisionase family DNA binding protein
MSRDEAAKYLGVSTGAVNRYTARGKLKVRAGADGSQPSYDVQEVRRLKEEMDARVPTAAARRRRSTLSLEEAVAATGLPREFLLSRAIDGRLPARWVGSAVRFRRDDLEELARGV